MRALLIVNPHATGAGRTRRAAMVATLRAGMAVDCVTTQRRGHAGELAADAAADGVDLVVTLGGDGTMNEVVNGLLTTRHAGSSERVATAVAPLPCGSTNVFARALGLPRDPLLAARQVRDAAGTGRRRYVGLGLADDRYFTFCAGFGLDAQAVRAVEAARDAGGGGAAPRKYIAAALRGYVTTDRRDPALLVRARDGRDTPVFLAIVSNTAPWTYVGPVAVNPNPRAGFDHGLDLFGLRRMGVPRILTLLPHVFGRTARQLTGPDLLTLHDEPELLLRAHRPTALQIDGEYLGEYTEVRLRSVPGALPVIV